MTTDEILARFRIDKHDKPDHWMAYCPAHEADGQHQASLSVKAAQDRMLLHCHGGCKIEDVLAAAGLEPRQLFFDEKPKEPKVSDRREFVKAYDYHDPGGRMVFQTVRWKLYHGDGTVGKTFTQRRPDGNGGWIYNLEGITPLLYRLPEVVRAIAEGRPVWITEGEKDADTLAAAGLCATCNPMGAGKWRDHYTEHLRGARVVLMPDADRAGLDHGRKVYAALAGAVKGFRWLPAPGGQKDVTDYREKVGATPQQLRVILERLAELAPHRPPGEPQAAAPDSPEPAEEPRDAYHVEVISDSALRQMTFVPPRQVIPGLIHSGVTILAAGPKVGKSFFCLQGAQAVAHGGHAFGKIKCDPGDALCFFMEDGGGRIQSRLRRLDAADPRGNLSTDHLSYVFDLPTAVKKDRRLFADKVLRPLTDRMENLSLVVVDTLAKIRPRGGGKNQNLYETDYDAIEPFQELAKSRQVAVVFVHHTRKMLSEDPLEEVSGTLGLTGSADSIIVIKRKRFERRGTLSVISRDIGEAALAVDYDEETNIWTIQGPADQLAIEQEQQEILEILGERPAGMEPHAIGREIGKTASGARKILKRMYDLGIVTQDGARWKAAIGYGRKTARERFEEHLRGDKTGEPCSGVVDGKSCPVCERLFEAVQAETRQVDGRAAAAGQ